MLSLPRLGALALLAVAPAFAQPAPQRVFRPDLFFAGRTQGTGTVTIVPTGRRQRLAVEGNGHIVGDGTLVLDQAVSLGGKTERRSFRIRRLAGNRWRGSLTDAAGPVTGIVSGHRLRLSYPMKTAGMRMSQTLTLRPDGRSAHNRATVTLLGIPVARVDEVIVRVD